ncbi:MAG TPA: hypothetical protein V6D08_12105 [Candidatus Obscuribacterales bacterium]
MLVRLETEPLQLAVVILVLVYIRPDQQLNFVAFGIQGAAKLIGIAF